LKWGEKNNGKKGNNKVPLKFTKALILKFPFKMWGKNLDKNSCDWGCIF